VATAESEYRDIRARGLRAPVAVIPNGIALPPFPLNRKAGAARRRLLFLARLHPVKGVDLLLRAWVALQSQFPDWELQIAGPLDGDYPRSMQALAASLGAQRLAFAGELRGRAKADAYLSADLFVLPTHSENFGMAVAEALAHGVPAVVTNGAPWEGLETERCGWWVERGETSLTGCLREAMTRSSADLETMGRRGREWMLRDFSWAEVARKTLATYAWLLGGGSPPDWVRVE